MTTIRHALPTGGATRLPVRLRRMGLLAAALLLAAAAQAQPAPLSYTASPEVYRVMAENPQYRVVEVTWQPGQKDALHSHPAAAVYFSTDCQLRFHGPDGATRDGQIKTGYSVIQPAIPAHAVQNIGTAVCRAVMFEIK